MKNFKILSLLALLFLSATGIFAQGGNAVVSEVKFYDMGNGTAILAVRVSGNQASTVDRGSFTVSGDRVPGGTAGGGLGLNSRVIIPAPTPGGGNGSGNTNPNGNDAVILTGMVPYGPSVASGPDFVTVSLRVEGDRVFYHWGSTVSTSNP